MLRRLLRTPCVLLLFLLTACAHGQIGPLPPIPDPDQSAVVYVLRSRMLPCGGERAFVSLDEAAPFVSLRGGENAGFRVPAGSHTIRLSFEFGTAWVQEFLFAPHQTYYLLVQPGSPSGTDMLANQALPAPIFTSSCSATLIPLTEKSGRHRVRSSKAVLPPLDPLSIEPVGSPASSAQEPPGSPPHSDVGPTL